MDEFFRGWRRKIGVLTLVMACVFMVGWVRSEAMFDMIAYADQGELLRIASSDNALLIAWSKPFVPRASGH